MIFCFFCDFRHGLYYGLFNLCLIILEFLAGLLLGLGDHRCDILHIFEECHGEPFAWKFFSTVHRPVSVLEIVVFHAAELLDVAVAAVMVGHEKSFCRDDFSCASASELHYGILERGVVDAVDLLRCEFAAEILHGLCVHLLDQRKKPHSLICPHAACKYCQSSNNT